MMQDIIPNADNETEEAARLDSQKDMYLTFHLAGEDYGAEIQYVNEIIGIQRITPVPEMPPYIKGMINLRGKIIPIMDMRKRFRLPEQDYTERTCIIVIDVGGILVGLVVDTVKEVLYIPEDLIEATQTQARSLREQYIKGMGKTDDGVKIILSMEYILGKDEFDALQERKE